MPEVKTAAVLLGLSLLLGGCAKKQAEPQAPAATVGTLAVSVENVVGTEPLVLDTRSYLSPSSEAFTVTTFNYYLSNFSLRRADGSEYAVRNRYFLLKEALPGSKQLVLDSIPVGDYTGLSFLIGVDEAHNTAGAQTGALDPLNGMFWTWNQGYIFLQMEGTSPRSGDTGSHLLAYHVGDFHNPNNLRVVAPPLPAGAVLHLRASGHPSLRLRADLLRLFTGAVPELATPVPFGPMWYAVGGREAGRIATNYSGSADREVPGVNSMFTVTEVRGE